MFITIAIVAPIGIFIVFLVGQFNRRDDFDFLRGQVPFASGVDLMYEHEASEYRLYSWRQSYWLVRQAVGKELSDRGFRFQHHFTDGDCWANEKNIEVWIGPGRSQTRREAIAGRRTYDLRWVTVIVEQKIPDSWVAMLRRSIEPTDY